MSSCRVLLIANSLLVLCLPAVAGHYEQIPDDPNGIRNPSGGHITIRHIPMSFPYANESGGYGLSRSGGSNGNTGESGEAKLNGQITCKFRWVRDYASEPVPKNVITSKTVTVSGSAFGYNSGMSSVSATYDCGTGEPGSSGTAPKSPIYAPVPGPPQIIGASTGFNVTSTKYEVVTGAETIDVKCTPAATVTTTNGSNGVGVRFSASATAVQINLTGTTPDATGAPALLTGQGVTASLSGVTFPSNFQWGVTGEVFKDFTVTNNPAVQPTTESNPNGQPQGRGFKTGLLNIFQQQAQLSFFTLKNEEITVACTADALLPDGTYKEVQAERNFSSYTPIFRYWNISDGTTSFGNAQHTDIGFYADADSERGQDWKVKLDLPEIFQSAGGQGGFVQVFTPTVRYFYDDGTVLGLRGNGMEGLDTNFPYTTFGATSTPDGTSLIGDAGDSPGTGMIPSIQYQVKYSIVNAQTWLIFQPYNSASVAWVPLRKYTWAWYGNATRDASGIFQLDMDCVGGKTSGHTVTTQHPYWDYQHLFDALVPVTSP